MLLEERERRRHLHGCSSRWRGALRNSSIIHIVDKICIIRSQCRFPSHLCLCLTQSFSPDSLKTFLQTKFQTKNPSLSVLQQPNPCTIRFHLPNGTRKTKQKTNKLQKIHKTFTIKQTNKQTNKKRKQKEEERIIFIEQKNYTNFITKNSQQTK
jgi:hypothetical protein